MNCTYTTNYGDFKNAQRLHMTATPKLKVLFWISLRILPVVGLIVLLLLVGHALPMKNSLVVIVACGLVGAGTWGFIMAFLRPLLLRRLYKQMKNGRSDDAELGLEIADGQLISRIPGLSEGRFFPAAVLRFVENDKVALLYVAKKRFLIIPKSAMNETEWSELRAWLGPIPRNV
jgi:hypothetical protein